jgi:hypothetical protein
MPRKKLHFLCFNVFDLIADTLIDSGACNIKLFTIEIVSIIITIVKRFILHAAESIKVSAIKPKMLQHKNVINYVA